MSNRHTGTTLDPVTLPPITREQLKAYAEASGDPNPIHLDEEVAKKAGLPGIIAHGMLIAGFLAERAEQVLREENQEAKAGFKLKLFQTRFKAMTLLGDIITIHGSVKDRKDSNMVLDLQAKNQRGEVVSTAQACFESV